MNETKVNDRQSTPQLGTYFTRGIRFHQLAWEIVQRSPKNLLVMGCGNGYLESVLGDDLSIVSVDIGEQDLRVAQALNSGRPNRDFRLMSLYDLANEFEQGQFRGVVISEVLEHLEDDVKALEVAHHCLAPEGTLFVTVPNIHRFQNRPRLWLSLKPKYMSADHDREYTLDGALGLVQKAGFSCKQVVGLDFWLPKDPLFRPVLPFGSPIRHRIATTWPTLATWFLLVCRKT